LIGLTCDQDSPSTFRAAWILEYLEAKFPHKFLNSVAPFIEKYPLQNNLSCKRHYTKILMHITHKNAHFEYKKAIETINFEPIVEATFEWLINNRTPVAVRVNCLDILYNLSNSYTWITEELKDHTRFLLKNESAAMQSRGKRVLKKIKK
jgi:hypothetical protein